MYTLYVNGVEHRTDKNIKLMDFLREDLRLTSVKNGCGEGACGTCTIWWTAKRLNPAFLPPKKWTVSTLPP